MQKTLFGDIFIFNRERQGGTDPIWSAPERLQALVYQLPTGLCVFAFCPYGHDQLYHLHSKPQNGDRSWPQSQRKRGSVAVHTEAKGGGEIDRRRMLF